MISLLSRSDGSRRLPMPPPLVPIGIAAALAAGLAGWALLSGHLALSAGILAILLPLGAAAAGLAGQTAALARLAAVCEAARGGNLEARLLEEPAPGALGAVQRGVNGVLDVSDAFVREAAGAMRAASAGAYHRKVLLRGLPGAFASAAQAINLGAGAMEEKAAAFARFAGEFEAGVGQIVIGVGTASATMRGNAEILARSADESAAQAETAGTAIARTAGETQAVAAAAEELSASVAEITRQVTQASAIARRAAEEAARTDATVNGLAEAAGRVGEVVKLIAVIAGQTNLLALNATIEAARAGEAGKGFAVVASEVKQLAAQTARATEDIARQITGMQQATQGTVDALRSISATVRQTDEVAAAIAAAVEEQGAATKEIARSVQGVAQGAAVASTSVSAVGAAAASTGSAATSVLAASRELEGQSARLSEEVAGFLHKARAA